MGIPVPEHTWEPAGCPECRGTGYRGRTGVFELWQLGEADYRLMLSQADEMTVRRELVARGHRSLLADGLAKADQGVTSLEELKVLATFYAPRFGRSAKPRAGKCSPAAPADAAEGALTEPAEGLLAAV